MTVHIRIRWPGGEESLVLNGVTHRPASWPTAAKALEVHRGMPHPAVLAVRPRSVHADLHHRGGGYGRRPRGGGAMIYPAKTPNPLRRRASKRAARPKEIRTRWTFSYPLPVEVMWMPGQPQPHGMMLIGPTLPPPYRPALTPQHNIH